MELSQSVDSDLRFADKPATLQCFVSFFNNSESLHVNFYEDEMAADDIAESLDDVVRLLNLLARAGVDESGLEDSVTEGGQRLVLLIPVLVRTGWGRLR